jgi:two-component system OmpR family response regulator
MHLLIIEDDREAARFMRKGLMESGHVVDWAENGDDGYAMACEGAYDVLVVDRMLPDMDGLRVVERLRDDGNTSRVLFLSALAEVDDRVKGLKAGGDDYLVKPYAFAELLARIDALARRPENSEQSTLLVAGDLQMDLPARKVTRAGRHIRLQPREFRLLEYLMRHSGQVVTRTMLLENVWDFHFDPQTNVIDVHISRLRAKIDKEFDHALLHTVRGAGYMLRVPD